MALSLLSFTDSPYLTNEINLYDISHIANIRVVMLIIYIYTKKKKNTMVMVGTCVWVSKEERVGLFISERASKVSSGDVVV